MRTDTIFYQLFQTIPGLIFELIGESPREAENYEFSSREVKELAFRFDGILLPKIEETEKPIYFGEVQFQPKVDFYWRLFTEIFVYLGEYKPENNWYAVAIFASRNLDPGVPRQYQGLLMSQQVKIVYLDELEETSDSLGLGIVQLVIAEEERAVEQTSRLRQKAKQQLEDEAVKQKILQLIETVLVYKFTNLSRQEIEAMFGLDELKQTRYFREVAEEFEKKGEKKGEEKGKLEGKLESVPSFLHLGLSIEQIATALNVDIELVKQAAILSNPDTPPTEDTAN